MPARGKHRRPKSTFLTRGLVAVGTGGAALALPAVGAASAYAAPAAQPAAAEKPAASTAATGKGTAAKKDAPETYSVVSGDTLYKIAEEFSVDGGWKKLYEQNRDAVGGDPSLILPGLELTVDGKAKADKSDGDASAEAKTASAEAKPASYSDNLDGWIKEALDIMEERGIPGTYDGIHRNIMRESGGDPQAVNNWDINAAKGTPSKGLLQVIAPTFEAYHVPGTANDSLDPVANIVAACNYAADRYGSIDNVNGPY